jgi:hypothetical protein
MIEVPGAKFSATERTIFRGLNKIGPRTCRYGSRFWQKEEVIEELASNGPKQIELNFSLEITITALYKILYF